MNASNDIFVKAATIRERLRQPVVMTGMMGSGKSRLGKKLAEMLNLDFFDTDKVIEDKAGYSVSRIFETDGEAKFREVEKKTILGLLEKGPCVIASGGGTVAIDGVMEILKMKSVTVWLKTELPEILKRLENVKDRPLLRNGDPEEILRTLMEAREKFYNQADITVEAVPGSPGATQEKLIKALYGHVKSDNF